MEYRFLDDSAVAQVLDDDALEERWSDAGVPDAFGIDDDNRTAGADSEAWSLAALDAIGAEEKALALEKAGEMLVELSTALTRRAEAACAHQHMAAIRIHQRPELLGHHRHRGR
jgi:hypothetical protein